MAEYNSLKKGITKKDIEKEIVREEIDLENHINLYKGIFD